MRPRSAARIAVLVALVGFGQLAMGRADEADDQYDFAANHYSRGQWKLAAEAFGSLLEKTPQHSKAGQSLFLLAECLLHLEKYDQALPRYREYLAKEPAGRFNRSAAFRAGEAAYFLNQLPQAKAEFQQFAAKYPDDKLNGHVLCYLGNLTLLEGNAAAATTFFQQCLSRYPDGPAQDECRLGLARALEKQGKNEEAERYYLALAGKPASRLAADGQYGLGVLQYAQGKHALALATFEAFEKSHAGSPRLPMVRLGRGWALMKLNRLADARAAFEKVAADPAHGAEGRYWIGLTWKEEKNWSAAAKTLIEAAAADPRGRMAPAMRFHAGDALLRANDFAAALAQFDQVVASAAEPEWIEQALRGKIQVALRTKDHATLDRLAAEFSKRFPQSDLVADVRRCHAQSLMDRNQFASALQAIEPLVGGAQKEARLEDRYLLARAYEGLERRDEALKALEPVLAAATGPLKADALLTQASLLVAMKRYAEALAPLGAFLATQPTGDAAVKGLGQLAICQARTRQLDQAKASYTQLLEKYPKHELLAPTTEQLAEAVYAAADAEWSGKLFAWLAASGHSTDRELRALSGVAWSHFRAGRMEEAAKTFEEVLRRKPGAALAAEAALVRGRALQQLNRADAALAMYDLVIQQYPQSPELADALWAAGRLRDSLKQHREALALYQRLLKEFPKFAELDAVLYKAAWTAADLGQTDESSALFERIRKEFPKSSYWPDALFRLAQRAFEAKDYARAGELVESLLASSGGGAMRENALYLRGQVLIGQGQWKQAQAAMETLVKEFPAGALAPMARFGVAEAIFHQGDFAAAEKLLRQLAELTAWREPSWPALVRLRLAQTLCHQQRWKDALELASQIEKGYPGFDEQYEVDYVIGRCLADQANFEGAREAYRRVIRSPQGAKTESAAKAQLMIAESFYHQKNFEAALREYLRVEILYAFPAEQAAALMQAGRCHEHLGEWKEAAAAYARLIKNYPNTSVAQDAGSRLAAAQTRAGGKRP